MTNWEKAEKLYNMGLAEKFEGASKIIFIFTTSGEACIINDYEQAQFNSRCEPFHVDISDDLKYLYNDEIGWKSGKIISEKEYYDLSDQKSQEKTYFVNKFIFPDDLRGGRVFAGLFSDNLWDGEGYGDTDKDSPAMEFYVNTTLLAYATLNDQLLGEPLQKESFIGVICKNFNQTYKKIRTGGTASERYISAMSLDDAYQAFERQEWAEKLDEDEWYGF